MSPTDWYLLILWLHLAALALWLGSVIFFLIVFGPAVHGLRPEIGVKTLNRGRAALESAAWVGIGLVIVTGIVNLTLTNPAGFPARGGAYSIILAVKLFLFFAMLVHHCLQVFKYGPQIAALTAQVGSDATDWPEPLHTMWRKWFTMLKINAGMGPIVVLLGLALAKG